MLLEASNRILSDFDKHLVARALWSLKYAKIEVRTGALVKEVKPTSIVLNDGQELSCGII